MEDPEIATSARKHGISDDDMLHAYRNPIRARYVDDQLTLVIGPARDGALLELGVLHRAHGQLIIHAMAARRKHLR